MKWILLIIVIIFSGCKTCGDCTRTWMYQEYRLDSVNGTFYPYGALLKGPTEYFDICGGDDILEQTGFTTRVTPTSGGYIEGYGMCTCITK